MLKIVPFDSTDKADQLSSPRRPDSTSDPIQKFISIRTVLVFITLVTVISLSIGLIVLNVQGQNLIAKDLGRKILEDTNEMVLSSLDELFSLPYTQVQTSSYFFANLTVPPMGANMITSWSAAVEHMWSITRMKNTGVFTVFEFDDARFFGLDNFEGVGDIYIFDFENGTLVCKFWAAPLTQSILAVDFSPENVIPGTTIVFPPPYPLYDPVAVANLLRCNDLYWLDVHFYGGIQANWELVTLYQAMCNNKGNFLGRMGVSVTIQVISDVLAETTKRYEGRMFIMDPNLNLVASSTKTPIYGEAVDLYTTPPRIRANETSDRWIRDVLERLEGNFEQQNHTVTFNGTKYLLSVMPYNTYGNFNWKIVQLFNYDQFLGKSPQYTRNSIYAAVAVAISAIAIVLVVTYFATKPLFILANDLKRMSHLETNYKPIDTPRLFEVRKLYRSVAGMNMALRSFKKFVPMQVVSKIIESEKEVTPELRFTPLTVMFQDIEGFTSIAEHLDPSLLARLTGEYMSVMTDIIVKHKGTIDKYIGDCIMSLFNAPDEVLDHQLAAVEAAVECCMALIQKNKEWRVQYGVEMNFRTGINFGQVLVGNMGSENRMNYTAFGDDVNIAARLEGANKCFGTRIIVSKKIHERLPKGKFLTRKLGKVKVSGKQIATGIYEVRGDYAANDPQLFVFYEAALKSFKHKDYSQALNSISKALQIRQDDKASLRLRDRIQLAIKSVTEEVSYIDELTEK